MRPWLVFTLVSFVAGCAASPSAPATPTDGVAVEGLSLAGTRWSLAHSQLAASAPGDHSRVRLDFSADRLSARSGCNSGRGGYRLEGGKLVLAGPLATTKMACPGIEAEFELRFFGFLASQPRVRFEATDLWLESDQGVLRLRAEPVPSAAAVQKFIYVAAERVPCVGVGPMQCLQVRDSPEQPWRMHYQDIIGFTHEPGIEYRLRILEDDVPNPPADGSSKRWFLDLVVEQRVVRPNAN
jgi:heat shock protein HslJ